MQVTEQQLRAIFQPFGEIVYVKIPSGKGCGFVQFTQRSNAETAMLQLNGQVEAAPFVQSCSHQGFTATAYDGMRLDLSIQRQNIVNICTQSNACCISGHGDGPKPPPALQMVGNSSIRISWGRSSANRNAAGVALGMGMGAGGFPQAGAFGRFGDSSGLAAAYGGFAAQGPGVIDPCVLHSNRQPALCCLKSYSVSPAALLLPLDWMYRQAFGCRAR